MNDVPLKFLVCRGPQLLGAACSHAYAFDLFRHRILFHDARVRLLTMERKLLNPLGLPVHEKSHFATPVVFRQKE